MTRSADTMFAGDDRRSVRHCLARVASVDVPPCGTGVCSGDSEAASRFAFRRRLTGFSEGIA